MKPRSAAESANQAASAGAAPLAEPGPAAAAWRSGTGTPRELFRFFRYFSVASLFLIAVAGVLLALLFRHVAIGEIAAVGEANNVILTEAAIAPVTQDLIGFLDKTDGLPAEALLGVPLPPRLDHELAELEHVPAVARIKIYNAEGIVVHATRRASIGRNQSDNEGVRAALAGQVRSKLVYRDAFNAFDRQTEEDNLIQTYVPIRASDRDPVRGVFELYLDVNPMVRDSERAEAQIVAGALAIMALLYAALVSVVRYAERIIRAQHEAIRQRNASLETLSARMLRNQEEEKRKIAFDLHEGIAQTLSAVKLSVESTCDALRRGGQDGAQLAPAVKVVKEAISEVRTVALHLRPSSLDELGLLATIKWYCREFARLRPQVCADCAIGLQEKDLPEALKIIIYRVLEEICRAAGTLPDMRRLRVGLTQDEDRIVLSVSHDGMPAQAPGDADPELALARERTLLSGGSFEAMAGEAGSRTLRAAWLR